MSGELYQQEDSIINLHLLIREKICHDICPGDRHCKNLECVEMMFKIAGQIELKIEAKK